MVIISSLSFIILSLLYFFIGESGLPILSTMSKIRSYFHVFSSDIFVSILFISPVIFTISLLSLTLGIFTFLFFFF